MAFRLTPVRQSDAKKFIWKHHRHNIPSITAVFCIGLSNDDGMVGVAMGGLPKARLLMDGTTNPGRGAVDLFGNQRIPQGPKRRWRKQL